MITSSHVSAEMLATMDAATAAAVASAMRLVARYVVRQRHNCPEWVIDSYPWLLLEAGELEQEAEQSEGDLALGRSLQGYADGWHLDDEQLRALGRAARQRVLEKMGANSVAV